MNSAGLSETLKIILEYVSVVCDECVKRGSKCVERIGYGCYCEAWSCVCVPLYMCVPIRVILCHGSCTNVLMMVVLGMTCTDAVSKA